MHGNAETQGVHTRYRRQLAWIRRGLPFTATHWGGFSCADVNPELATRFLLATQGMPPLASETGNGVHDLGTRVLDVSVS